VVNCLGHVNEGWLILKHGISWPAEQMLPNEGLCSIDLRVVCELLGCLAGWFVRSLVHSFVGRLVGCLVGSLVRWLVTY